MKNQPTIQPKIRGSQWTILKLLNWTTAYFKSHLIDSPRSAAEILLAHALKLERIDLYLRFDQPLCSDELVAFKSLIKRRLSREPVAYIVGFKGFWSLDLVVTPDVLIPRPETESLVQAALAVLPDSSNMDGNGKPKRILELGTGSGAITLALASELPNHYYFATDRSIKAVQLARRNAERIDVADKINFIAGSWFTPLKAVQPAFDMIISNPPYIRTRVIQTLQPEICRYEPLMALDGQDDGLGSIRHIIRDAHLYLKPKGRLLLEIGHDQKKEIQTIIDDCAFYDHVIFSQDYHGNDRVVQMQKEAAADI